MQVKLQMQSVKTLSGVAPGTNRASSRDGSPGPSSLGPSNQERSNGGGTKRGSNTKKKEKKDVSEKPKDVHSRVLFEAVRQRLKEAEAADRAAEEVFSTFERKLGASLKAKGQKIPELLRDWDKDGTGEVKKMQFRQKVRGSLGIKANNVEIDKFFNSMDEDGGGSLDLAELKPALKFLLDAAQGAEDDAARFRQQAAELREKAAQTEAAAQVTEAAESEEAELEKLKNTLGPPDVQLGNLIIKRNLKIGDIITKWDPSNDGSVDKKEFRANVLDMGVISEPEALDELFDSLDDDGGGELDVGELKELLKKLIEVAKEALVREKELETSSVAARKSAKQQQALLREQEAAKAKAEKEAEEAARKAAEEKAEAARKIAEAKAAAAAAAAKKKAEEKAEYEAKIAARRAAQKDSS